MYKLRKDMNKKAVNSDISVHTVTTVRYLDKVKSMMMNY